MTGKEKGITIFFSVLAISLLIGVSYCAQDERRVNFNTEQEERELIRELVGEGYSAAEASCAVNGNSNACWAAAILDKMNEKVKLP